MLLPPAVPGRDLTAPTLHVVVTTTRVARTQGFIRLHLSLNLVHTGGQGGDGTAYHDITDITLTPLTLVISINTADTTSNAIIIYGTLTLIQHINTADTTDIAH